MFRVDTSTADVALPAQNAQGTPGYFTQGNPGNGTPATVPGQDWFNIVQEELMNLLTQAGIAPAKATTTQIYAAILKIIQTNAYPFSKTNFAGVAAPVAANDSTQGYSEGSMWYDTTHNNVYLCISAAVGAAVWKDATLGIADLGSMATQNANNVAITGGTASGLNTLSTDLNTLDDGAGNLTTAGAIKSTKNILQTFVIDTPVNSWTGTMVYRGGAQRWHWGVNNTAESGANAGADWELHHYADNGADLGMAVRVFRSTANMVTNGTIQPGSARWRKHNITDFSPTLEQLTAIRLREFDWLTGAHDFGSVADEVHAVFPELTTLETQGEHKGEPSNVNYPVLGFIYGRRLLDEVIELRAFKVNAESALAALESRIKTLESRF